MMAMMMRRRRGRIGCGGWSKRRNDTRARGGEHDGRGVLREGEVVQIEEKMGKWEDGKMGRWEDGT